MPPHCYGSPLSLCVGCSASSLPEGCFPNHINERAMLQPGAAETRPILEERSYLHCTYTNLTALIKEQKIKPLRPLSINLESYPNTVVRGWLAITNVSVFNELFHQKQKRRIKYLFWSKLFQRWGTSIPYNPCWARGPGFFLSSLWGRGELEAQLKRGRRQAGATQLAAGGSEVAFLNRGVLILALLYADTNFNLCRKNLGVICELRKNKLLFITRVVH